MRFRLLIALLVVASGLPILTLSVAQDKTQRKGKNNAASNAQSPTRPMAAAKAFLELLNAEQNSQAVLQYGSEQRVAWHFIPMETRKGLPLRDMSEDQKQAAKELLKSVVSQMGFNKATTVMQLETILLQLEGPKSQGRRDPEKYYFTLFGKPAMNQVWGLSVEGHHLSLNFSLKGNQIVDSTPQFFGANPAKLAESYGEQFKKGMQVLKGEEELAFELVNSLDEGSLKKATLPGDVPQEIRGAGDPQPPTDAARGIAAQELSAAQQATLKKLIEAYSSKMKAGVAKQRWELIENADFGKIHFAWAGAKKPGIGHYYIVQGPTFLIEFINVQADAAGNPANHIHCVWRDLQGDFNLPIAAN